MRNGAGDARLARGHAGTRREADAGAEKPAEETGSGPNVTKPPAPGEQPRSEGGPEHRHDRDMSTVAPVRPRARGATPG